MSWDAGRHEANSHARFHLKDSTRATLGFAAHIGMTIDLGSKLTEPALNPGRPYRKLLLSPEKVREFSRLRPATAILDTICCWVTIAAAWALVAIRPEWWTLLIAIPVVGTRYYALFIIGHDGLHRRLFHNLRRNDFFNDLFVLGPIGGITRINNRSHLHHHHNLGTNLDPDRHKHGCFNKTNFVELAGYLAGITSVWRSFRNVFVASTTPSESPDDRYRVRDVLLLAGWQAALLGGLTWAVGWWGWPVLWLLPVYAFTFLGDNLRSFAEHSHPQPDRDTDAHRLISYVSNPLERLFLAPLNMNCHAVHHIWPSIPYYHLPLADAAIRGQPGAAGLEWRRSYLGYLCRYFAALPLPQCKPAAEISS
jgi:fatty acid desaturase